MINDLSVEAAVNTALARLPQGFTRDRSRWTAHRDGVIAWRVTVERDGEDWGPTRARVWIGVLIKPIHEILVEGDRFYYPASFRTVRGTLEENLVVAAKLGRHQFRATFDTRDEARRGFSWRSERTPTDPVERLENLFAEVGIPWLELWSDSDRLLKWYVDDIERTHSFYPTVLAESLGDYARADSEYARLSRFAVDYPLEGDLQWVVREIGERFPRLKRGST